MYSCSNFLISPGNRKIGGISENAKWFSDKENIHYQQKF